MSRLRDDPLKPMDRSRLSRSSIAGTSETDTQDRGLLHGDIQRVCGAKRYWKHQRPPGLLWQHIFWYQTHNLRATGEQRRERVTKVALEFLRQVSVAEQISWDVTVEEMWLFAKAFNYDEAVLEEPLTEQPITHRI